MAHPRGGVMRYKGDALLKHQLSIFYPTFYQGANMNSTTTQWLCAFIGCVFVAMRLAFIVDVQQPDATSSVEQEFFDAIRDGKTDKVNELLRQRPALLKARVKNGASPVLYAVYAKHPEIAESFIARGVEPNIFEAAITGRIERVRALLKQDPPLVKA